MQISVIIPHYNEEAYLSGTLETLDQARTLLGGVGSKAEIIVVDNDSSDATAEVARKCEVIVISETVRNIARVRNAGAHASHGDVLVFIDADTIVPDKLL